MRRAVETVAWAAFAGERDDWIIPWWAADLPRFMYVDWLRDWAAYWRFQHRGGRP